ncbi:MAG: trigger factor [Deltaproteobacteria bacterium]|nr:trigger factor [Deltaproteobacteria bacterium]
MTTIEEISNTKRLIQLEIPLLETNQYIEDAIGSFANTVKIKGFRPGKIPRSVLFKSYLTNIKKHVIDNVITPMIYDIMEKNGVSPLALPLIESITIVDGQPILCTITFDVFPTFDLPDLSTIEVKKQLFEITDEAIDYYLEDLRKKVATLQEVDQNQPIAIGDTVEITVELYHKKKLLKLKEEELKVSPFVAGVEEGFLSEISLGVIGLKHGDVKEIDVRVPANYPLEAIAGKKIVYKVSIKKHSIKVPPEISDEFAQTLSFPGVTNLDSLREYVRQNLANRYEENSLADVNVRIMSKLLSLTKIETPQSLLTKNASHFYQAYVDNFNERHPGVEINELISQKFAQRSMNEAELQLLESIIMEKIKFFHNIHLTDEDLKQALQDIAFVTGKPLEAVEKSYAEDEDKYLDIKYKLETQKIFEYLRANVKIVESSDPKDFYDESNLYYGGEANAESIDKAVEPEPNDDEAALGEESLSQKELELKADPLQADQTSPDQTSPDQASPDQALVDESLKIDSSATPNSETKASETGADATSTSENQDG